jgi:Sulfatase
MFPSLLSLISTPDWRDVGKKALLVLLLPVFFILKGYDENFGLIPLAVLTGLFFRYILISLAVFVISLILLRKLSKAVLFSLFLLCIFFFFGAFHDFLKKILKPGVFTSYTLLLPLIFVFVLIVFFLLRKSKKKKTLAIKYCSYLLSIITILEIGTLGYKFLANPSTNNLAPRPPGIKQPFDSCLQSGKPDIFFVVLDGYTSSKCLQEEFNYSNKYIDLLLKSNHFFTSIHSKSNYNLTPFSLSSTLDWDYLKPGLENHHYSTRFFLQGIETLKNNELAGFLKKEGYLLQNFSVFDFKDAPTQARPLYDNNELARLIDDQTIYSRIMRDIGWNFTVRNYFTGEFKIPKTYKEKKELEISRDRYNWDKLLDAIQTENDSPRFVYTHVMLPHDPFYFKKDGSMVSDTAIVLNNYDLKAAYLDQLQYTNSLLGHFIQMASKKTNRERVVIIQGDHGFRDYGPTVPKEKEFMNLNAYYFSDHNYSTLYDSISPVNSFRVVLNKYFCQSFPLLKDSSVYLNH